MKVEFYLRGSGPREFLTEAEMDAVPPRGDLVDVNGTYVSEVHSVTWDLPNKRAIVLLKG